MAQRNNKPLVDFIAQRFRKIRMERGISQVNVYIDTNIHVARIEAGRANTSISTIYDLCNYYQVTLKELFKDLEAQEFKIG